MAAKRTDSKGRILLTGESQRQDGRYAYKYTNVHGESKFIYSWKLNATDPIPKGKRQCKSLREMKKELLRDEMDGIDSSKKKMTVCELYEKQNSLKPNVRKCTLNGRNQLMNLLKADKFGSMYIENVKPSDAKEWALRMSKNDYAFQTINNYKRSLKASFYTAVNDDLIRKNPFNWKLTDILTDDTKHKEVLTKEQTDKLLEFVKNDAVYNRYYNEVVVLLNTGLRISELCGLTVNDLDFENGFINVNHQLLRDKDGYHVDVPKTESGLRKIPMLAVTRKALQEQLQKSKGKCAIAVDGYSDFIFLNARNYPMYAVLYNNALNGLVKKHNKMYKDYEFPHISPHVLRHTFCTNMANARMTPNNLQYIMGHKNITMTLGYYTHASCESAMTEMLSIVA